MELISTCSWSPAYLSHNAWLAPQQNHQIRKPRPIKHSCSPTGSEVGVSTAGTVPFTGDLRVGTDRHCRALGQAHECTLTADHRYQWGFAEYHGQPALKRDHSQPRTSEALPRSPEVATPPFSQSTVSEYAPSYP